MGAHLIDGEFQSDKYPSCPRGKVPLSVKDTTAQDLLWEYAQRRRVVDAEFSADMEAALRTAGYRPLVATCVECQPSWSGLTNGVETPTPKCVKCGKACVNGYWNEREVESNNA